MTVKKIFCLMMLVIASSCIYAQYKSRWSGYNAPVGKFGKWKYVRPWTSKQNVKVSIFWHSLSKKDNYVTAEINYYKPPVNGRYVAVKRTLPQFGESFQICANKGFFIRFKSSTVQANIIGEVHEGKLCRDSCESKKCNGGVCTKPKGVRHGSTHGCICGNWWSK
jgi:hypothetical protein